MTNQEIEKKEMELGVKLIKKFNTSNAFAWPLDDAEVIEWAKLQLAQGFESEAAAIVNRAVNEVA